MEMVEKIEKAIVLDKIIVDVAERLFYCLGIPFDEAINVFLYQAVYTQSIPFPITIPLDFGNGTVEEYIVKKYGALVNKECQTDE